MNFPESRAILALLVCAVSVQAATTVWSAFAYVSNGERVPLHDLALSQGSLTSLGAQQMFSQGSTLRSRWLTNMTHSSQNTNVAGSAMITDIQRSAIDNSQLAVYSTRDAHVTAGAIAFMQGLYPPKTQAVAPGNGGLGTSVLANGSLIEFPLEGYMYPNIWSLSLSEPESVWIEGHVTCTEYLGATGNLKENSPYIAELSNSSFFIYQKLWSTVFQGLFPAPAASFEYAYDLYAYASYQYVHNVTIREVLLPDQLSWLAEMANIQQFAKNADLSVSGREKGDMIRAISGRTLAGKAIAQFEQLVSSQGEFPKLSLMFGSFEPMLAFFSLSGLATGQSSELFQEIPQLASTMILELFSDSTGSSSFPDISDLWVRFLYRNGTADDAPVVEYPLSVDGTSQTRISYHEFVSSIQRFSIDDVLTWCKVCDAANLFCAPSRQISGTREFKGPTSNHLSSIVSGIIGATVAIAIVMMCIAVLVIFGKFRFLRPDLASPKAGLGSIGAERMASDKDLSISHDGTRHERVGSWELGDAAPPGVQGLKTNPAVGTARVSETDDDGDSMIMGRQPVKPLESI